VKEVENEEKLSSTDLRLEGRRKEINLRNFIASDFPAAANLFVDNLIKRKIMLMTWVTHK
jgi:hypothetical protein